MSTDTMLALEVAGGYFDYRRIDPGESLELWIAHHAKFIVTQRGRAAALHFGDPAFAALRVHGSGSGQGLEPGRQLAASPGGGRRPSSAACRIGPT